MNKQYVDRVSISGVGGATHGRAEEIRAANVVAERPAVHWSVYLVFAATCLLISGLASDPRIASAVQSLFAMR
jgi:hypothetical protein